jgi:hypothetical protein
MCLTSPMSLRDSGSMLNLAKFTRTFSKASCAVVIYISCPPWFQPLQQAWYCWPSRLFLWFFSTAVFCWRGQPGTDSWPAVGTVMNSFQGKLITSWTWFDYRASNLCIWTDGHPWKVNVPNRVVSCFESRRCWFILILMYTWEETKGEKWVMNDLVPGRWRRGRILRRRGRPRGFSPPGADPAPRCTWWRRVGGHGRLSLQPMERALL